MDTFCSSVGLVDSPTPIAFLFGSGSKHRHRCPMQWMLMGLAFIHIPP